MHPARDQRPDPRLSVHLQHRYGGHLHDRNDPCGHDPLQPHGPRVLGARGDPHLLPRHGVRFRQPRGGIPRVLAAAQRHDGENDRGGAGVPVVRFRHLHGERPGRVRSIRPADCRGPAAQPRGDGEQLAGDVRAGAQAGLRRVDRGHGPDGSAPNSGGLHSSLLPPAPAPPRHQAGGRPPPQGHGAPYVCYHHGGLRGGARLRGTDPQCGVCLRPGGGHRIDAPVFHPSRDAVPPLPAPRGHARPGPQTRPRGPDRATQAVDGRRPPGLRDRLDGDVHRRDADSCQGGGRCGATCSGAC
mmetsp:Transcript_8814/g.29156  ORF Transcript_8814/g.29156 Transcript_8814/m.29156 type:complete len:299 (+) Transcript_8814:668-1564(+)